MSYGPFVDALRATLARDDVGVDPTLVATLHAFRHAPGDKTPVQVRLVSVAIALLAAQAACDGAQVAEAEHLGVDSTTRAAFTEFVNSMGERVKARRLAVTAVLAEVAVIEKPKLRIVRPR